MDENVYSDDQTEQETALGGEEHLEPAEEAAPEPELEAADRQQAAAPEAPAVPGYDESSPKKWFPLFENPILRV